MKQGLFTLSICLGIWGAGMAQSGLLRVQVRDAVSGEPLPYALVRISDPQMNAYADSLGFAEFVFPVGAAWLEARVSMLGYAPQSVRLHLRPDVSIVHLQPDASLGEVVVSGTLKPVAKSESPVPVDIYTPNFFKQAASPSLFDGLRMANGIRPQITCNVCAVGDIRINGLDGPYTMVLIDGMPIVSALSTVYGLQGIPASLIERVEVVKGPASTLYGSEALAGVINIITRDPNCAPAFSADLQTNSYGEWNADVGLGFRAGNAAGLLSGNLSHLGRRWDVNGDGFTDVPTLTRYSAFGKMSWSRQRNRLASLSARYRFSAIRRQGFKPLNFLRRTEI